MTNPVRQEQLRHCAQQLDGATVSMMKALLDQVQWKPGEEVDGLSMLGLSARRTTRCRMEHPDRAHRAHEVLWHCLQRPELLQAATCRDRGWAFASMLMVFSPLCTEAHRHQREVWLANFVMDAHDFHYAKQVFSNFDRSNHTAPWGSWSFFAMQLFDALPLLHPQSDIKAAVRVGVSAFVEHINSVRSDTQATQDVLAKRLPDALRTVPVLRMDEYWWEIALRPYKPPSEPLSFNPSLAHVLLEQGVPLPGKMEEKIAALQGLPQAAPVLAHIAAFQLSRDTHACPALARSRL